MARRVYASAEAAKQARQLKSEVATLKRKGLISPRIDVRKIKIVADRKAEREVGGTRIKIADRRLRKAVAQVSDVASPETARVHGGPRVFKVSKAEAKAIRERNAQLVAAGRENEQVRIVRDRVIANADQTITRKSGEAPRYANRGFSRHRHITVIDKKGREVPGWRDRIRAVFDDGESYSASLADNGASMTRFYHNADDMILAIETRYELAFDGDDDAFRITLWSMEQANALYRSGTMPRHPKNDKPRPKNVRKPISEKRRLSNRLAQRRFRERQKH